jgi:uncharacterized protein YchJ
MKPRYEETSSDVEEMLRKAQQLEKKIDTLEKAKTCPCGSGKPMASCCPDMDMKKAKMCPCGSGKPMASCCPDMDMKKYGSVNMKKGEHHKEQAFSTEPENAQFMIETGGQTYNAFYTTNQSLLDSTDVANKGASSSSLNLDALSRRMNTHDANTGHVVESGE